MESRKNNNFLKHFTVIGSGTVINLCIGLITTPIITRLVTPMEYGQLSVFNMYSSMALIVLCLGLDQALVRYFYECNDTDYRRALLFRCIKLPVILCISVIFLFVMLIQLELIYFEFNFFISVLLCINIIIQLIYRFSQLIVRLTYKSKLYSALNILQKVTYVICVLFLLNTVRGYSFCVLAFGTVVSHLVCLAISVIAQREMWNIKENNMCHISMKELINYAYPYIFAMGITTFFQAIDKLSLNYYCSYNEVGIYSSAMTLIHIFAIIQTTFNTLWAPMAVEHFSQNKEDKTFYQMGNSVITVVMFLIGITLILFKDLFVILLGEKYRDAAYILPFLTFNPIMYTISETTVSGLVFMKKSGLQIVVAVGACITNIVGNILLVPKLGCQGAAISTGISYIVFFSLRTLLSNLCFKVDYKLIKFYLLTLVAVIYAFYNTFIKFNAVSVIGYVICLIVLILLYRKTIEWGIKYLADLVKALFQKHGR